MVQELDGLDLYKSYSHFKSLRKFDAPCTSTCKCGKLSKYRLIKHSVLHVLRGMGHCFFKVSFGSANCCLIKTLFHLHYGFCNMYLKLTLLDYIICHCNYT